MIPYARQVIAGGLADRLEAAIVPPEVLAARRDYHAFCEYCFSDDDTGNPIRQAHHHRVLHSKWKQHKRLVVWFPVEHGKTLQSAFLLVWLLGHNPGHSYAVVSATHNKACKTVARVKREIDSNRRVREVFPRLRAMKESASEAKEEWGRTRFRVEGRTGNDPSLAAYGIDGDISGARLHGVIVDNVLDRTNTASKKTRQNVLEAIDNEVLTRKLGHGFCLVIDTAWMEDDALHVLAKRDGWHSERFDATTPLNGGDTLWPEQFPRSRLRDIQGGLSKVAFDRMYRNLPLSASVGCFKQELLDAASTGAWMERYTGKHPICTGVDLSTGEAEDRTVFITAELLGHKYRVLNIRAGHWSGPEIVAQAIDIFELFHKGLHRKGVRAAFRVESNGQQKYIHQLMKSATIMKALGASTEVLQRIVVEAHNTTRLSKVDLSYGLPSVADDMEMGRCTLPTVGSSPEVITLHDELRVWTPEPGHHTGDSAMALLIAKTGLVDEGAPVVAVA